MSKYDALGSFLRGQGEYVPMTFREIERVTGTTLPNSKQYPAWWSNNTWNNVMTKVWLEAGYRTEQVDIAGEKLVFRRAATGMHQGMQENNRMFDPAPKTASHAPHPIVGALKGTFTIEPGWDLTKPVLDEDDMDTAIEKTADLIDKGLSGGAQ
jgi:hypothetical protein